MAFTSTVSPHANQVADFLLSLSARVPGNSTVGQVISFISNGLVAKLTSNDHESGSEAIDDPSFDSISFPDSDMDDAAGDGADNQACPLVPLASLLMPLARPGPHDIKMLQLSLEKAQSAGLCVGLFLARPACMPEAVSLSMPVSKLHLPVDAREAWGLGASEHVVFVRLTLGYPSLSHYLHLPAEQTQVCFRLVSLRRRHGLSWVAAQEALHAKQRGPLSDAVAASRGAHDEAAMIGPRAPAAMAHDFALDGESDFSIPLVAMQVALRQFLRCTESCMVCYGKLEDGPRSLKPYVCNGPLCLYQHLTLGFGPSIEHEIISSPYVVDLLVCFFYTALWHDRLREFPKGLMLMAPDFEEPNQGIAARVRFENSTVIVVPQDDGMGPALRSGDLIALFTKSVCGESPTLPL